ncbi:TonB-dependent siderophore receptor [uncultured Lacinutrix sp.]|uniref:TonB-dependent receptor plug domain-containing protein n=1 Tax=uncultured Lacinutrix sp. TaxID=574032 RepID=UPI002633CED4|nr:TonB-dependent receptor [uncultured Lacinutrix sp.]
MKQGILFLVFILVGFCSMAQTKQDSIQKLEEVVLISDSQLKTFTNTQSLLTLNDSIIEKSKSSLTDLLNNNSPIYFKENGLGMVSSVAFRGTTAQQTSVVWNGININSQLNGQTDFNTINVTVTDQVTLRSGGGSVLYGSGAIGGSVHLNNIISFKEKLSNNLNINYGSFNTLNTNYKGDFANKKWSINAALGYVNSDNDYDYVDSDNQNLNGQFNNKNASINVGFKFNESNILKLYSNIYDGSRNFSLALPSETPSKYDNFDTRHLLEWNGFYGKFTSKIKLAYLTEAYKYFQNIQRSDFSEAKVNSSILKYDASYSFDKSMLLNAIVAYTQNKGNGTSIQSVNRRIGAFNLLFKHKIVHWFLYETTVRQETTNSYTSPFLYSIGLKIKPFKVYSININGSKNFRIPTFNDLYWEGSGNLNLKPETSKQIEVSQQFQFKNIGFNITGFYNDITDMIRWLPIDGVWKPINTDEVVTYGIETKLEANKAFNNHKLTFNSTFAYTISENKQTKKQLIYVPFYKVTANLGYNYKKWSAYYQYLYVGDVFTQSDNNPKFNVDEYYVSNFGLDYSLGKQYKLGAKVNNLFNENYESIAGRFMPGRHYNFYINFNF